MERAAAAKPHAPLHTGFLSSPWGDRCAVRLNLALQGEKAGPATQSSPKEGKGILEDAKDRPGHRSSSPTC
jgi:hypothetical protein